MLLACLRRYPLLRTALLVMLALGVMIKPVLAGVSDLHQVMDHAPLPSEDHGHDHDPDQEGHDHGEPDQHPKHAQGAHGLMHQTDAGSSTGSLGSLTLSTSLPPQVVLPSHREAFKRDCRQSSLFRPPIV